MGLLAFVRATGSPVLCSVSIVVAVSGARDRLVSKNVLERMFFGSAGYCISKKARLLCRPEFFSDQYTLIKENPPCKVRVLLDQKTKKNGVLWTLSGKEITGYCKQSTTKQECIKAHTCVISIHHGKLHVNNTRCTSSRLDFDAGSEPIQFNGNKYHGTFTVLVHDTMVDLINTLDIEEYVSCVLRTESWPGWPLEVNKVLAVAVRTYVIAKILESKRAHHKVPYHIKNTNIHQTYSGLHTHTSLKQATKETEGIIMAYKGKPIVAMFDACCGGIVPAVMQDIDFSSMPYLKRAHPCTFCQSSRLFSYDSRYSAHEMRKLLKNQGIYVGTVKDMCVLEKDKAGIVQRVMVTGDRGTEYLSKHKVYALCKKIKSFAFDISKSGGVFTFKGNGFGHHLGLCQWGAREMVAQKWSFKNILKFYYPGIQFVKIAHVS